MSNDGQPAVMVIAERERGSQTAGCPSIEGESLASTDALPSRCKAYKHAKHNCYKTPSQFAARAEKFLAFMLAVNCPEETPFKEAAQILRASGAYSRNTTIADISSALERFYNRAKRLQKKS